jgi:hypothetical protein
MPLQSTSGAATYDAFGSAAADRVYIEDVMSTFLYTGNGSTQTITNGIDLSTKGGLVWLKGRNTASRDNLLSDTTRGAGFFLVSNSTAAQASAYNPIGAFNANGFDLNSDNAGAGSSRANVSGETYASWTFRKQPKFFDVVTYTGNGSTLSVNHALASKPGCIIIKRTDSTSDWLVCTRKSTGNIYAMYLNTTAGQFYDGTEGSLWTSTAVSINWINSNVAAGFNTNGATYVMYLFAHDAGGFGLSGTDNVISCGSFTTDGSGNATVTLGYEPQFLIQKKSSGTGDWYTADVMRGWSLSGSSYLNPNTSSAEGTYSTTVPWYPTSTGFVANNWGASTTYIYIAIRRGPMKVPTSGTSVYYGETYTGNATARSFTAPGFPPDLFFSGSRSAVADGSIWGDRLRGADRTLYSAKTQAESTLAQVITAFGQNGASIGTDSSINGNTNTYVGWNFRRAPGFFDVVCYTGNDVARTVSHNLGAVPELIIVKARNNGTGWCCYAASLGNTTRIYLNQTGSATSGVSSWNSTTPTSSVFSLLGPGDVNQSGYNYVAYLFATVAGVSKVGSYTGTAATLQIDCGFTGGARFVLIKRTDSTGDWYVYDTARGIVSGNDSYLLLNSTAAEVTNTDYVDTYSAGFELSSTAPAGLNANGGTYIFLAIA